MSNSRVVYFKLRYIVKWENCWSVAAQDKQSGWLSYAAPTKKKGEPFPPLSLFRLSAELELVAPGEAEIDPVAALPKSFERILMGTVASEVARHVISRLYAVGSGQRTSLTDIGSVIP